MRTLWKVLLPLALVLPMTAYVAGSLVTSRSDDPAPRETIVIRDAPAGSRDDRPEPPRSTPGSAEGGEADKEDDRDAGLLPDLPMCVRVLSVVPPHRGHISTGTGGGPDEIGSPRRGGRRQLLQ